MDVPSLSSPDVSKIDLPRFLNDLQKYRQWLSPAARADWEQFRSTSDQISSVKAIPWEMHTLVSTAIRSTCNIATPPTLSSELVDVLEKEKAAPKKVNFFLNVLSYNTIVSHHIDKS